MRLYPFDTFGSRSPSWERSISVIGCTTGSSGRTTLGARSGGLFILAIIAAFLQYPLYGAVCGLGAERGRSREALIVVAAVHVCSVVICIGVLDGHY
jgi:hypothetical protein